MAIELRFRMSYWQNQKAVFTGGSGFLGSYVVDKLRERGCTDIFVPRSADLDLTEKANVRRLYAEHKPDVVIHLAAVVGDIAANRAKQKVGFDARTKFEGGLRQTSAWYLRASAKQNFAEA